ncbi:MAG: TetR/AcrR family transcriptional regulator [Muribaculaceae bacterium]|nr:TetR/AcrR family transcriptional regulator [Muribaculaceae bacterium]
MDVKEHIILEAGKLLQNIGPTSMTMDMVARTCGISKRTLYEKFPDKRTLIKECLEYDHQRQNEQVKAIFDKSANCFEALFRVFTNVREYMHSTSMAFVGDMKRLYPELFAKQREQEHHFVMALSKVLRQAQSEGHVLPGINTDIAAFLFLTTIRTLHESDRFSEYTFSQIEAFDGAFLNFLRGIATHDGRTIIDAHVEALL